MQNLLEWHNGLIIYSAAFALAFAYPLWVAWSNTRIARTRAKQSHALLRRETQRHESRNARTNELAWREFCDRNELPESTRIMLHATVRKPRTSNLERRTSNIRRPKFDVQSSTLDVQSSQFDV